MKEKHLIIKKAKAMELEPKDNFCDCGNVLTSDDTDKGLDVCGDCR